MQATLKSKWPDFLFTISVRFVCGILFGALTGLLFFWRGILRSFSHDHTHWAFLWLGICSLTGGIVAVFTVPRWQTPWYKRQSEILEVFEESAPLGCTGHSAASRLVEKSVSIKIVDEEGREQVYASLEEAPPEIRSQLEELERQAVREPGKRSSTMEASRVGDVFTTKVVSEKNVSIYKIVDESGAEHTYHSLEEMPPDIRAAMEEAERKTSA
jgi:hypothetical protein